MLRRTLDPLALGGVLALVTAAPQDGPAPDAYEPLVHGPSSEAEEALAGFAVLDGLRAELFAAEPLLANPVCFAVDGRMRFYVAETFRLHAGVTDMREHMDWLDDELACRTVADRVAMMREHEGEELEAYRVEHDRVRRVVDSDGDGVADRATVFAGGFAEPAAGIGAGLLPVGRDAAGADVYYACIPDMWLLSDGDGDGVAERRESLHTGWGVHVALLGHDMHGIVRGPDGRLYWSIGDRGFHVEHEGRTHAHHHAGAVLRSELDGSGLEVFATGLRNPQELAFDDHGNLFTGDNNSDGGDRARWTYVMEGGESGWRHAFQYVTRPNLRGPWNAERLWEPFHDGQPAYTVPPIANFTDGPSGLACYPGTGWGPDWRGTFVLCDFRGTASHSGVHAFRNEPQGAGFELVGARELLWGCLATDADFAPDGHLYVTDWVAGWGTTGKGRIYRLVPDDGRHADERAEVRQILEEGMAQRPGSELGALLAHGHRGVRLEAQWELARRALEAENDDERRLEAVKSFVGCWESPLAPPLARLHTVWGIGQVLRGPDDALTEPLLDVLRAALEGDPDDEVRAHVLRVLGDVRAIASWRSVLAELDAPSPRLRAFAAEALGKLGDRRMVPALLDALAENDDRDPWLRHALVWALVRIGDAGALARCADDARPAVRRGAVVALRRLADARAAEFLDDGDPSIVAEAARAIYDVPIEGGMAELAARLADLPPDDPYLARRALNACRALGGEERLAAVADHCVSGAASTTRTEALEILAEWMRPSPRDRVVGEWRPLPERPRNELGPLSLAAAELFGRADAAGVWGEDEWLAYLELVRSLGSDEPLVEPVLSLLGDDRGLGAAVRRAALVTLAAVDRDAFYLPRYLLAATRDADASVRAVAFGELAAVEPDAALTRLVEIAAGDDLRAAQEAVRILGGIAEPRAAVELARLADALAARGAVASMALELAEALAAQPRAAEARERLLAALGSGESSLGEALLALEGGDAAAGRRVFLEKAETACLRCHAYAGEGGSEVGPALTDLAARMERRDILEAIVDPGASIADGYENWSFALADGTLVVGRVVGETDAAIEVETPQKELVELDPAEVQSRRREGSSMPADVATHLSRRELRDLVEFLATGGE